MRRTRGRVWIVAATALLACAGCGFKGPLYLPNRNATVVTHPAQPTQGQTAPGQTPSSTPAKGKDKTPPTPPQSSPPQPPPP